MDAFARIDTSEIAEAEMPFAVGESLKVSFFIWLVTVGWINNMS